MVVVRGRLDPEVGAMLMRAVEAASDALFREAWSEKDDSNRDPMPLIDEPNTELQEVTPEQRRADAMGLIAERALAAGFGGGSSEPASAAPISGSRAERYQVMLHVEESTLKEFTEPGLSELEDGTRVSAETSRRLSCDCGVVKIGHGPEGEVTGAGRTNPHHSPGPAASPGGQGPGLSLSGLRAPLHRGASHPALGRRRRDEPPKYRASCAAGTTGPFMRAK